MGEHQHLPPTIIPPTHSPPSVVLALSCIEKASSLLKSLKATQLHIAASHSSSGLYGFNKFHRSAYGSSCQHEKLKTMTAHALKRWLSAALTRQLMSQEWSQSPGGAQFNLLQTRADEFYNFLLQRNIVCGLCGYVWTCLAIKHYNLQNPFFRNPDSSILLYNLMVRYFSFAFLQRQCGNILYLWLMGDGNSSWDVFNSPFTSLSI